MVRLSVRVGRCADVLKVSLRQWGLVSWQGMMTCPAAAEQNDGDKRRKNSPGKITTVSVGQGEPPSNLLTVIHKGRKSYLKTFLLRGYDFATRIDTDNGDKSKLPFPCSSTFRAATS